MQKKVNQGICNMILWEIKRTKGCGKREEIQRNNKTVLVSRVVIFLLKKRKPKHCPVFSTEIIPRRVTERMVLKI